ncbi:glycosaminoglycan xylosylkinase-like [Dreissena polymorpha]|uniref:FAM20 C-terminal domain-containing protein n=1 Tax=Dreissena polymorpha TaxID=45954 RepID=A0A9D4F495_DREPO|nr:glycosaminoglycan xylosylkinase-like [Dreissena polymorpha]XP_052222461.1 glycosaminoglycan xylosylkinase-like [Dreissena polymorpha]KAH3792069.1 hypothetical protein DPMN_145559 [Dreissena polymorpha]
MMKGYQIKYRTIFICVLIIAAVCIITINKPKKTLEQHNIVLNPEIVSERNIIQKVVATDTEREFLIKKLVERYTFNWGFKLDNSPWTVAANWFSNRTVLPSHSPELGGVLRSLATREVTHADVGFKGTQLKLLLVLQGGQRVAFKPEWFKRDDIIEGPPYAGADRHNGEIAAFHLSRLLELRRTPLTVGRVLNLEKEVKPVATETLLKTFFTRDNNTCFYGKCFYCKDESTGVCGEGPHLEGSVTLWLPSHASLTTHKHPWARTYKTGVAANWEDDPNYCKKVILQHGDYWSGPRLLDIVDTAIFDYLIGNADRHRYETYGDTMIMLDNAKSFGNPSHDEKSILAPLYQCCRIRETTWLILLLYKDGALSQVLRTVLMGDPISPILSDSHLEALDRRLRDILHQIEQCVIQHGVQYVFIANR